MGRNQMLVLALANVPTIITVLIGILINNGRFSDMGARFVSIESRMTSLEMRLTNLEHKFDTRFDLLLEELAQNGVRRDHSWHDR
jgi:hypothetical protein